MKFLEKDLENYIFSLTDEQLFDKGLMFKGKLKRQVFIKGYGFADLISVDKKYELINGKKISYFTITVFELKKGSVNIDTYFQALRYCYGIKEFLNKRNFYFFDFEIVLIGNNISNCQNLKHLKSLSDNFNFYLGSVKSLTTYEYLQKENIGIFFNFK
jgi:hypothetical protein